MQTQTRRPILRGFLIPLALCASGLLAPSAHAQSTAPVAGTTIGNKASATYTDNANVSRSTLSNTVSTTVTQVPAVNLTAPRNIRGYPSAPVNFSHTVTNTGNGPDSFNLTAVYGTGTNVSPLSIYADANGDGIADNNTPITVSPTLQPGQSYSFVVTGTIPGSATAGSTGTITVGTSSVTNSGVTGSNTDTVTVSTNANIVLRKSVSLSSGAPSDTTQYTYTLSYVNNSQKTAGSTVITDTIPTGLKYVPGSGVWQGNALTDISTDTDATITNSDATTSTIKFSETGQNVSATISSVPPGQGVITFKFTAPAVTAPGVYNNTANISYDDGSGSPTAVTDVSNTVPFTVSSSVAFTFTGPPAIPSAPQGSTVSFNNTLTNNGTGTDTFNITLVPPGTGAFPAGTTFQLYKSDGVTPLLDTNGDGIPDTGPVASKGTYVVVLKALLPSGATGGPFEMDKVATSITDKSTQTAQDKLTVIKASSVDLTNLDNTSAVIPATSGPFVAGSGATISLSGNPGSTQIYPLRVINNGPAGTTDSFALSVSTLAPGATGFPGALPAGYTVVYRDKTTGQVLSSVDNLAGGGGTRDVLAYVTIPTTAVGGTSVDLYFKSASPTSGTNDTVFDRATVNVIRSISVKDNNSGQVAPGGSVTYLHTITNTGDVPETIISVTKAGDANGFSSALYPDTNGNGVLDPAEQATPLTTVGPLAPGQSVGVFVKVFGPVSATQVGGVNTTTLTGTLSANSTDTTYTAGTINGSSTDSTTLVFGDVKLDKQQSLTGVAGSFVRSNLAVGPGGTIYYQITVTNTGTAPVTSVVVNDATPAYTTALAAPAPSYTDKTGAAVTTGITAPAANAAGSYTFPVGTLAPGASSTIVFAVKVQG